MTTKPKRRGWTVPERLSLPTCRRCHDGRLAAVGKGEFVRYGKKHYAHALCYLLAGKSVADAAPEIGQPSHRTS